MYRNKSYSFIHLFLISKMTQLKKSDFRIITINELNKHYSIIKNKQI